LIGNDRILQFDVMMGATLNLSRFGATLFS